MFSKKLLDKLGVTEKELNEYSHLSEDQRSKHPAYIKLKKVGSIPNRYADGGMALLFVGQANTCCGICELAHIGEKSQHLAPKIAAGLCYGFRGFIYYANRAANEKVLLSYGFKEIGKFKNHNTRNTIRVMFCQVRED